MKNILTIAQKDLTQIARNRMTFLFLLIMPVAFTLMFAYAFSGTGQPADPRLPVGYLDQDGGRFSPDLELILSESAVIRLQADPAQTPDELARLVSKDKLAAAVIVPAGWSQSLLDGTPLPLTVIADETKTTGMTIRSEVESTAGRVASSVRAARISADLAGNTEAAFSSAYDSALTAWKNPPVTVRSETKAVEQKQESTLAMSAAHSSPGMMLQFAIAGLLTAATVMVNERKSRSLQRMLTTATRRVDILLGHFMAIFAMIFGQFVLLIVFGQLLLKVDYFRAPLATLLVAIAAALCISALGLLIGAVAKSDEQATIFSLIPMFILSGLGGAWMPLEYTGKAFQAIGHVSPVAWAMDGFKNLTVRGLGIESAWLPAAALIGYAALFFAIAAWRFSKAEG
jgi:ABC-2 type transport system permease protein